MAKKINYILTYAVYQLLLTNILARHQPKLINVLDIAKNIIINLITIFYIKSVRATNKIVNKWQSETRCNDSILK